MTEQEAQNADASNADAQNADATAKPEASEQDSLSTGFDALPQETQDEIRRLRRQTADYRTRAQANAAAVSELEQLKAAQRKAEDAKAKEKGEWEKVATQREAELEELRKQIAERDMNDKRAAVARKHSLPDEIADRLVGDDDDALEADAKRLAKLFAREDGPDTDSGKRSANGPGGKKQDSLLATYEFGKRR